MDRRKLFCRVGVYGAMLAGVVVFLLLALPNHIYTRLAGNETAAFAALRTYLFAQNYYQRTEGRHATLAELGRLLLIGKAMAEATSPDRSHGGYYFAEITSRFEFDVGLCAVPAVYGKTGRNTFVIDVTGVVYWKDTGGNPVRTWPDIADGWTPIGTE